MCSTTHPLPARRFGAIIMGQKAFRILVIDSEPQWINFTRDDLGKDFQVEQAKNVTDALQKLDSRQFDLVIASSMYNAALQQIREAYPLQRIAVATNQPTVQESIKMYRLGAFDYFPKDFKPESLSERVTKVVRIPVAAQTA